MSESKVSVLLVEDDSDMRAALRDCLLEGDLGAVLHLREAATFGEGMEALLDGDCGILLVDHQLGGRETGLDLLREARRKGIRAPAIVITGHGHERIAVEAMKAGASDYLVKSLLTTETVQHAVGRAIELLQNEELRREAERRLRESEERHRALLENSYDAIGLIDRDGRILYASPATTRLLGYRLEDFTGHSAFDFVHPRDTEKTREMFARCVASPGSVMRGEFRMRHADGSWRWMEGIGTNGLDDPAVRAVIANFRDVTERKEADTARAKLASIVECSSDAIIGRSLDGRIESWNKAAEALFGYTASEVIGKPIRLLLPEEKLAEEEGITRRIARGDSIEAFETERIRKDGLRVAVSLAVSPIRSSTGRVLGAAKVLRDISDRKRFEEQRRALEEQIRFQAFHDALTGLPNRTLFEDRLGLAIAQADRNAEGLCVMFLDVDHFKSINDTHGHSAGDSVLKSVANRLRGCIREHDSVARIGGDEFLLLFPELGDRDDAARVGRKLLRQFHRPVELRGLRIPVTASIGIALYRLDGNNAEQLLKTADSAMYRAKALGRNQSSFLAGADAGPTPPQNPR